MVENKYTVVNYIQTLSLIEEFQQWLTSIEEVREICASTPGEDDGLLYTPSKIRVVESNRDNKKNPKYLYFSCVSNLWFDPESFMWARDIPILKKTIKEIQAQFTERVCFHMKHATQSHYY